MADIVVSGAGVAQTASTIIQRGVAAEAIVAGAPIYIDATTSNNLRNCLGTSLAAAACVGIALNSALGAGQPVAYATGGLVTFSGTTLVVGNQYNVSVNSGKVAPVADTTVGVFATGLGIAPTATTLLLAINPSGVAHA